MPEREAPTVVDVFAGSGGFSLGFSETGFEIMGAVEKHRVACETFASNVPVREVLQADVRSITPDDFPDTPDVLIGGPPCEAFTAAAKDRRGKPVDRLYKDPTGSMTLQFVKLLKEIRPRAFVMENVPGLLEGGLPDELRMLFKRAGYGTVHFNDLLAEDAGTPSHRRRLFVSNIPLGLRTPPAYPTVWETIGDIASLDVDLPNHVKVPVRGKRGRRMEDLEPGESMYKYRTHAGAVHGAWTRLEKDKLSPTVMGSSRFIHPTEDRLLTPREHARLMGYPDDYVFHGGKNDQYNQAGESVPPHLSAAIARQVRDALARGDV